VGASAESKQTGSRVLGEGRSLRGEVGGDLTVGRGHEGEIPIVRVNRETSSIAGILQGGDES